MPSYQSTRFLPFHPAFIFEIVSDIEKYPDFLPWCHELSVLDNKKKQMEAEMSVSKGPFEETFRSIVTLSPHKKIQISLVRQKDPQGFLRELTSVWLFEPISDNESGTNVSFSIDVSLSNFFLNGLLGSVFGDLACDMVEAFEKRAYALSKRRSCQ